jgi:predicted PolB exonuclease-like 3'-5' exonuclease
MKLFIDIETLPEQSPNMEEYKAGIKPPASYKKQESIDKWLADNVDKLAEEKWLKTSLDGTKGQICCIGIGTDRNNVTTLTGDEKSILIGLNNYIIGKSEFQTARQEVMFIAHNAKFDLPFIHKRMVINQVKPQFKVNFNGRHGQHHFCTMEAWAGFNGRISQKNLCKALGLPGNKDDMDGSQVWPEYQKGNIDKIAEYCKSDVLTVIDMYERLTWASV